MRIRTPPNPRTSHPFWRAAPCDTEPLHRCERCGASTDLFADPHSADTAFCWTCLDAGLETYSYEDLAEGD